MSAYALFGNGGVLSDKRSYTEKKQVNLLLNFNWTMDTKLKKWIKWLKIIESEIYDLIITKDIFWEVQDLIKKNKKIQKPSIFNKYMGDTYISHVIIGIRRQVKIDNKSISFARLLSDINKDPIKITRNYFINLYKGSAVEDIADNDFDQFCGEDRNYISHNMVKDDLDSFIR